MDTATKEKISNSDLIRLEKSVSSIYYSLSDSEEAGYYLYVKRVFDIIVSAVVVVGVLSWLYPILAILINLSSRGGTLFIQKRVGFNGKEFLCYKFRTMVINKDSDLVGATWNDKRITRIGRLLRASYIDELPQFINVLKGEMSIIGPRPHMLYHHKKFCAEVPFYNFRHQVKPGITGMAQVKGYHGWIADKFHLQARTKFDLFYVQKISWKLDMMILMKTISAILLFNKNVLK